MTHRSWRPFNVRKAQSGTMHHAYGLVRAHQPARSRSCAHATTHRATGSASAPMFCESLRSCILGRTPASAAALVRPVRACQPQVLRADIPPLPAGSRPRGHRRLPRRQLLR
eukprot:6193271-Pleurochrysis_carterae.AAC.7